MYNALQKVRQALDSLSQMTPAEYSQLDNDAWQLVQDVRDCCKALADRVDVLEVLQPIPPAIGAEHAQSIEEWCREVAGHLDKYAADHP